MEFIEKYISTTESTATGNKDNKTILSDDAFAVGEVIDDLMKTIENLRISIK